MEEQPARYSTWKGLLKNVNMNDFSEVEFLKGDCLFLSLSELVRSLQRD